MALLPAPDRLLDDSGETVEDAGRWPMVTTRVARSLWDDHSAASGSGIQLQVHNHLDAGHHEITLDSKGSDLHARLRCHHDPAQTDALVVCLPVGRGRGAYSHKVPLPVSGELRAFGRAFELDADECTAILDIHQAHYPRETWWKWATFVGRDARGRRVAVNLTRNVVKDEAIHENALWIDGRLQLLGPSAFALDEEPWRAGTADGTTSLEFTGQGERWEDLNLGVVVSRFRQRFGTFSGVVSGRDGPIELTDAFGLFEDHNATW
ncbi:MAG: DUF2804 family protein [Proteobacteria bacterium]|nr:DUF2804 family protein [Pseudomonadota bacterium]MCP4916153.1 DUF2804 family protein [Pseudomonadota bacterium]